MPSTFTGMYMGHIKNDQGFFQWIVHWKAALELQKNSDVHNKSSAHQK